MSAADQGCVSPALDRILLPHEQVGAADKHASHVPLCITSLPWLSRETEGQGRQSGGDGSYALMVKHVDSGMNEALAPYSPHCWISGSTHASNKTAWLTQTIDSCARHWYVSPTLPGLSSTIHRRLSAYSKRHCKVGKYDAIALPQRRVSFALSGIRGAVVPAVSSAIAGYVLR